MAAKKAAAEKTAKLEVSDKKAALESVMQRIERECGKGSIMRLGAKQNMSFACLFFAL